MGATKPKITLIPWDPESPEHIERLFQQRVACGWNSELVKEEWRDQQRSGDMAIQWVVMASSDSSTEEGIAKHIKANPSESRPLKDTASSFGGKQRTVEVASEFIPVGHISLDANSEHEGQTLTDTYTISTFYISTPLQSIGLGRAAMEAVERMATSPPLSAKTFLLKTSANENYLDGRLAALEQDPPKTKPQDWYGRMEYEIYGHKEKQWSNTDKTGKIWWSTAVLMRKNVG